MNILFYDMGSYTYNDITYFLKRMGHRVRTLFYHFPDRFEDAFFCERFASVLESDHFDAVMSVNFFPLVASVCSKKGIKYLAWCYDSPIGEQDEQYFPLETNYIFLFDRAETERYNRLGIDQVFHLPLAVHTERLEALEFTREQQQYFRADVSFVGQLYSSSLDILLYAADDYVKGYVEGMIQAQLKIYGYNLIDELVTDEILDAVNASFKKLGQTEVSLNRRGLSYEIAKEITHFERSVLVEQMGELFDTHVYTTEKVNIDHIRNCGPVKYYEEMPGVFRYSKLNLCPTLRCIKSGIPLRALDIMGAGGVLLSSFQPELAEYFVDGESVIMYESLEDAVVKADYYLKNPELLNRIAISGHQIVKEQFSYPDRLNDMFEKAGIYEK